MKKGGPLQLLLRSDWLMSVATLLIVVTGMLFVYSAAHVFADRPVIHFERQLLWMGVGLFCYLGLVAVDYRRICREGWWIYAISMALLVLVLCIGLRVRGGRRWLMLLGVGFQPSEFAKVATIVLLAQLLSRPKMNLGMAGPVVVVLGVTAVPALLVMLQPDLGTALVFLPAVVVMMFVAGMPPRMFVTLTLIGLTVAGLMLSALFLPEKLGCSETTQKVFLRMSGLRSYHKERITGFLAPKKDPLGAGWTKVQSQIAIGSGGLTGKGFRKGTSNILGFLPRSVAPTDFLFSVVAEESGFFGAASLLFLFAVLLGCVLRAGAVAVDETGRLLCVGAAVLVFTHIFVNIAMTIGLLPVTGLPLPLMSSGGSFFISVMMLLGMAQSVFVRRYVARY